MLKRVDEDDDESASDAGKEEKARSETLFVLYMAGVVIVSVSLGFVIALSS